MKKVKLLLLFILVFYSCNRFYHGVDNIKDCFVEQKEELVFLKESAKDSSNIIKTIGWYKTLDFKPYKLDFTTTDGKYPTEEDFYRLYGDNKLAKKQIEAFKKLDLKFFSVDKTGATFMFNNTGKCIHLMGLDSVDYNTETMQASIGAYKRGAKTSWVIPLDAHWYIYTDCD
jgi:hypothetical protein